MKHASQGRRRAAHVLSLAALLALAGCAATSEPAAPAVQAIASEPDAAGVRVWWVFTPRGATSVRAHDLAEATTLAERELATGGTRDVLGNGLQASPERRTLADSLRIADDGTASMGIGGGGR